MIDAVPMTESQCRLTALNLNFNTKEFYEITRNATGACDFLGVALPKLDKPRIAQLVDGKDIVQKELETLRQTAYNFLSSAFRSQVDHALKNVPKQ